MTVSDLGPNGQLLWQEFAAGVNTGNGTITYLCNAPQIAVRGDGAVIITEATNAGFPSVSMSGQMYPIPPSTVTNAFGTTIDVLCCVGPPMVNTDGTAYLEYEVRDVVGEVVTADTLYLMQINPDNSSSSTVLSSTTQNETQYPGNIIPDGQGGVLATWSVSPLKGAVLQYPYQAVDVVAGVVGTLYNLPFSPQAVDITKQPDLVLGENGVAFVKGQTTATVNGVPTTVDEIISFNLGYVPPNLGPGVPPTPNWTYQAQPTSALTILAILSDDSLAVNNSQNGVTRLDASGNPTQATSSLGGLPQYSWTGDWYVQGSQGTSALTLPFDVDEAGVWATPSGNPSDNGAADALCECDLQSTSDQQAQAASREVGPRELAQAASVANCAICNLPPPSAPATSCAVFTAPGSTYLILVGDSGTDHNVKQGFNLAAQQNANELQAQGNNVIACRISTATDLNNALTKNGSIGGGVVYYGHSGPYLYSTNPDVILSILAIGNAVGGDSNLHYHNIGEVCPPPGCSGILNSNITFAINGCRAGKKVAGDPSDASGITQTPIAKILARQISIRVSGYLVGTYFSLHNAATASSSNYKGEPDPLPQSLPMYLIPEGAPGNKKAPTAFCAVGNCPN